MNESISRRQVLGNTVVAAGLLAPAILLAGQPQVDHQRKGSPVARAIGASYKDGQYTLPPLEYPYDALEPHIDAQTMQLHHSRHHQSYVTGLNNTLKSMAELRAQADIDQTRLNALQEDLTFHGSGHLLHSVFWSTMAPNAGGQPQAQVGDAITKHFGSFSAFRNHFGKAAGGVKGSGWAILAYEPAGDNLVILQVRNHDLQTIFGVQPLLPLDVWEHAYYLRYQNARAKYVEAWWNVVNWPAVNDAYVATRRMYGKA
jgi:superoxide dismutase, Fe-Mn family